MAISLKKQTEENTKTPPLRDDAIRQTTFRQRVGNGCDANTPPIQHHFQHCMEFPEAITTCFKKYATFTGRATRAEYWWFQLFIFAVQAAFVALAIFYTANETMKHIVLSLLMLFTLSILIPSLSVSVRRLHDRGWPGWWLLVTVFAATLIPICLIAWIIAMCLPSGPANKYGDVPCMAGSF